jgi:hypothetical protein
MRAMFAILWLLTFVKLMQRIFNTWTEARSWHTGRNPLLIAAYMQYVTEEEKKTNHVSTAPAASPSPDEVMEMCQSVVDGERRLVLDEKKKMMTMTRSAGAQPKVVLLQQLEPSSPGVLLQHPARPSSFLAKPKTSILHVCSQVLDILCDR